ncbi:MAG: hypothetical protein WCT05_15240 [Lentisphaeria bacterium]
MRGQKIKLPDWAKIILFFAVMLGVAGGIGGVLNLAAKAETASTTTKASTAAAVTTQEWSEETALRDIEARLPDVMTSGVKLISLSISDGDLRAVLDMSAVNPKPLTLPDIVEMEASSITDEILSNKGHDQFWDTVTIDCGDAGIVTCDKGDIRSNGYGGRYFDSVKIYDQVFK